MIVDEFKKKTLVAHLKEAEKLFGKDEYFLTTIYSNRIISDSFIIDDLEWGLIGFIIRAMTMDYTKFKNSNFGKTDTIHINEVRTPGVELMATLVKMSASDIIDIKSLWKNFMKFKNAFRGYQHSELESSSYYSHNSSDDYTTFVSEWMIKFLETYKNYLYLTSNNLLKSIENEIERVSNLTGYNINITLFDSTIMTMDWYLDFVKQFGHSNPEMYGNIIKEDFISGIERLISLMKSNDINIEEISKLIWENLKNWRKLFMVFMELPSGSTQTDNKISLPLEFRNKLTDILTKSVKKEMGLK